MNKDTINLIAFIVTIAVGAGLCIAGQGQFGAPLLAVAAGHALPSPFAKKGDDDAPQDP